MGIVICSQAAQHNTIMRFLVTLGFLLAVASLAKSDLCANIQVGLETRAEKCLESFDDWKFITPYKCVDECQNCNLCSGDYETSVSVCQYCVEGQENCADLCEKGKIECCACDEAAGQC